MSRRRRPAALALAPVVASLLSACTTVHWNLPWLPPSAQGTGGATWAGGPNNPATPSSTGTSGTGSPPPAPSLPSPPAPPFDVVSKGAERVDGLLPLWKRQDKVWVELAPDDFGRAFFLSPKLRTGLGEGGFFGGLLASRGAQVGRPQWVEFRRVNQQVQLVAVNAAFTATPGTPEALAVEVAYSPSLLASVPAASAPHAERGTVLVELSSLLVGDVLGLGLQLQRTFRQNYTLDTRNTAIVRTRSSPSGLMLEVQQHFSSANLATSASGGGAPTVPGAVPDPRSLFLSVQYTLSSLPSPPMPPRAADPRVGHFTTVVADFSDDLSRSPRKRHVNRWRLEKKDAGAVLSEPVRPLVFWLDPSIPQDYRPTVREAVLEWNKAFAAIGFKDAIQVRDSGGEQPMDIVGNGQAIIRWMTNNQPAFGAIGPTHVDPRTGEILTADIALESLSSRAVRAARSQIFGTVPVPVLGRGGTAGQEQSVASGMAGNSDAGGALAVRSSGLHEHDDQCLHAEVGAQQLAYAQAVQTEFGDLPPDHAKVRAFVLAYLKDTTMHEVGHALGLRHNFKASRWRPNEQLLDEALTQAQGLSASVMDYTPINLGLPGQPVGVPFQTTLGPYDYWAIEYAYKPLDGDATAQREALKAIARRSEQPAMEHALAYGTDEDNNLGLDPTALTFDLGRDPIAFARQRLALAHALLARQATARIDSEDEPALLRRRVTYALRDIGRTVNVLTRQIGGVVTRRTSTASGRDALDPLPPATQRQALDLLLTHVLPPETLSLPPSLLRRLAPDYFERSEGTLDATGVPASTDFSIANQLMVLQRDVLGDLMSDGLAERLLDNIDRTRDRSPDPLTVGELHQRLREAVWAEPSGPQAMLARAWRRNLQRDHVNRLALSVVRGSTRADVRAEVRRQAELLVRQLQRAGKPASTNAPDAVVAEAHRRDALETLQRALSATVERNSP